MFFFALAIFPTTINQKSSDILNGEAHQYKKKTRKIVILNCYRRRAGGNCGQFVIRSFMCELLWEHWNLVNGGLADH